MNFFKRIFNWIKILLVLAWLLFMLLIGALILNQNQELVELQLFTWQLPPLATGVVLCGALLCGVILGFAAAIPAWWLAKSRAARLTNKLSAQKSKDALLLPAEA